jgi:hypothetical protein
MAEIMGTVLAYWRVVCDGDAMRVSSRGIRKLISRACLWALQGGQICSAVDFLDADLQYLL